MEDKGTKESHMIATSKTIIVACAAVLSVTCAHAGPCSNKDAGSGSTPGYTGQTVGANSATDARQHPPTDTMNRVTGEKAASSQDTQRQQQGQPTAAQQAQGAKPSAKMADEGC